VVPNARFDAQDVDRGLLALALASGRGEVACRLLEKQGMRVTAKTLRNWRDNLYTDRYWELQRKVLPRLQARAAEGHAAIADAAVELNAKLLERLDKDVDELPIRDVAGAARNVATVGGIDRDKAAMIRGEPTEIHEHRDGTEILRALRARGFKLTPDMDAAIDSTATEVKDED